MKVTINEKQTEGEVKYPCLMKSKSGLIVLMVAERIGTVLRLGINGGFEVGQYRCDFNMETFRTFKGSITLEND